MQANADMAELADASALGADVFDVGVQIPLSAPNKNKTNPRENLEFVFYIQDKKVRFLYCFLLYARPLYLCENLDLQCGGTF